MLVLPWYVSMVSNVTGAISAQSCPSGTWLSPLGSCLGLPLGPSGMLTP